MHWSLQVYLTAGMGALVLGGGVLLREPRRARNRRFALLCAALALWNLGYFANSVSTDPDFPWHLVFLLGSCAAAPLGLHFSLTVARLTGPLRKVVLPATYVAAIGLWISAWTPAYDAFVSWNRAALFILGTILLIALSVLFVRYRSLPHGPERNAHRLVFVGGLIAVLGGMSDFLPRDVFGIPRLGAASILVFLVMVCSVVVRHRFLDVDTFLIRVVIFVVGAAAGALVIFGVARLTDVRYFPMLLAMLLVLLVAGTLGRTVLSGARSLLRPQDPVARALAEVTSMLPDAVDANGVWQAIGKGREALPGDVHVEVSLFHPGRDEFRIRFRTDESRAQQTVAVPSKAPLPRLLRQERLPCTSSFLEREVAEAHGPVRKLAAEALEQIGAIDARLVVPLLRGESLVGWIAVGGGSPERYLTAEVATALLAVGNQAVACLDRIEATEKVKRAEALAAVGQMAAGLAHEVRNPVAAIRGAAQAISAEATPEQTEEMLEVISEETERLGRFVGEFLDYARPDSPRREPVDLEAVARQVLRAAELAGKGITTEIHAATGCAPALGDADQIRRAFENLVSNAREAAGSAGTLRIEIAPENARFVAACFEDNGPGIPDEEMRHLFRPFHTKRAGGTGLGLALVHRIVESHGGEIRVEGRPGRGAVFTLLLPAAGRE